MSRQNAVESWIAEAARPVAAGPADGPLGDLEPLRDAARAARVAGLGAATRGARELFVLQDRVLRFLVGELGFRTLALEEDWTSGLRLDAYVRTGEGDPRALLSDAWLPWRTEEVLDALLWIRRFNERHPDDPVRVFGLDFTAVRASAYDLVIEHVRRAAPDRAGEIERLYAPLRPGGDIDEHVGRLRRQPVKQPFTDRAEQAYALVKAVSGDDLAVHAARAVVDFHRFHALPPEEIIPFSERRMAANLLWWHERTGSKIVYWGGIAHAASGERVTSATATRTNTGGHLREALGDGYLAVGLTFDHGAVHGGVPVPPPPAAFGDAVLGRTGPPHYLLDLRGRHPAEVAAWLAAPAPIRVIGPGYRPEDDPEHRMPGSSPGALLDVVIHSQQVTPARPLR
ncbi:erythromycin esterase family protein [Actinomadura violacea]|uniref:Erythromycin esterase family protein n=1 Tax=Actinomadura violacea TaxID=2819934 RepID=A0ABS3RHG1_9ACTN|nr:erythromycin esterase family protein [Actinomadura violacea]MBO2456148.1 erythromycin esterase family protein [Actinomadura violacea]